MSIAATLDPPSPTRPALLRARWLGVLVAVGIIDHMTIDTTGKFWDYNGGPLPG